jgi:hypothetical protein
MTLERLMQMVEKGVQRRDLESWYKDAVNGALKSIQEDYSWTGMKHTETLTWHSGKEWVSLPADFKELQRGRGVVEVNHRPVDIAQGAMLKRVARRYGRFRNLGEPPTVWGCWLEFQSDEPVLRTRAPMPGNAPVRVSYYRYLPPLEKARDENFIGKTWPLMVVHRAKADLFGLINDDERTGAAFKLYEMEFKKAVHADALREIAGVRYQT